MSSASVGMIFGSAGNWVWANYTAKRMHNEIMTRGSAMNSVFMAMRVVNDAEKKAKAADRQMSKDNCYWRRLKKEQRVIKRICGDKVGPPLL